MPHEYKISLINDETKEKTTYSGLISDESWTLLSDFLQYSEELLNTEFYQSGMNASLKIHWEKGGKASFTSQLPDWNKVQIFLYKCRPIILQSEPTNFYRICNILEKEFIDTYFRTLISGQREVFSGKRLQSITRISVDEIIVNSEKFLHDWLNAYEYHRDKEKQNILKSLNEVFPINASKVIFISLLTAKAESIRNISNLIRVILRKQEKLEII